MWHPSQLIEDEADGSRVLNLQVHVTPELERLILGCGESAEVLAPAHLRQEIAKRAARIAQVYE